MPLQQDQQECSLLNCLPLGVFVLDREGRFTFVNKTAGRFFQALLGLLPADVLGKSMWKCCSEFADSTFAKEYQQAQAGLRTFELEAYYPSLERWFLILASFTEQWQCFSLQDVTAQKRLEKEYRNRLDQLAAALDAPAEFMMHVAQEMGEALAVLRSDISLTSQRPEAPEGTAATTLQK
jgi:PAS domain-containing protein